MGKNKGQKTKSKEKAFTVVHATKKSKTKEVKTNLKKINFQNKSKTDKADERFKALQETVLDSTKQKAKKLENQPKPYKAKVEEHRDTAVDMETATESLAKL